MNHPDFMIIGAQKAGTTSLHRYLQQHPQLVGSRPKEVNYFNRDIYLNKSIQDYKKNFRGMKNELFEVIGNINW